MTTFERQLLDMQARLEADAYFVDVPVFVLRPRALEGAAQIQTRIDQALAGLTHKAGKTGAAVTLLMPVGDTDKPNVPGPALRFTYTARVQEIIGVNMGPNGTGKSAEEIAVAVLQVFHHTSLNGRHVLTAAPDTLTPSLEADPKLTYDVRFSAQGNLPKPAKCAAPLISPASGAVPQTVTLTCATASAAIYYTTDGSYPSPLNATATRYTAALSITAACTLRTVAHLADYQQSDVNEATFT